MMDFQAKLGPLPVWAWGLTLGGAAVGYYYWQQLKDNNGATISTDPTATETVDTGAGTSDAIDGAFTAGTASGSTMATTSAPETTDTNSAWLLRAIQALIGKGVSPLAAQTALGKYLQGEALSADESALVNRAISYTSLPPEQVDIPTNAADSDAVVAFIRKADGSIWAVHESGNTTPATQGQYVAAGMPAFQVDEYTAKVNADAVAVKAKAAAWKAGKWDREADGRIFVTPKGGARVFAGADAWIAAGKPKLSPDRKKK